MVDAVKIPGQSISNGVTAALKIPATALAQRIVAESFLSDHPHQDASGTDEANDQRTHT